MLVATLISDPRNPALDQAAVNAATSALHPVRINELSPGIALDLFLPENTTAGQAETALRSAFEDLPLDIALQQSAHRRKRGLIADMDSTMIGQECIDELAAEAGFRDAVSAITARAMNGEITFEPALRERVALLKGLPVSIVEKVITERISLTSGGKQLLATMRAHGAHTALVSGGFTLFTDPIAARLGFHENRANILDAQAGIFTGKVLEPILGKQAKVDALREIAGEHGLTPEDFIAVGDGANDLGMLQLAGTGVALHAKPSVASQARIRIDHADLTALLYLQGYTQSEIIAA